MSNHSPEALAKVLDRIHDIALAAKSADKPQEVRHALDEIVALARYKSEVIPAAKS